MSRFLSLPPSLSLSLFLPASFSSSSSSAFFFFLLVNLTCQARFVRPLPDLLGPPSLLFRCFSFLPRLRVPLKKLVQILRLTLPSSSLRSSFARFILHPSRPPARSSSGLSKLQVSRCLSCQLPLLLLLLLSLSSSSRRRRRDRNTVPPCWLCDACDTPFS